MKEKINLDKINDDIADRSNVFYWQTDRLVTPEQAGNIWSDRHKYFNDAEIIEKVNNIIGEDKLIEIESLNLDAQNNLGNVNSVRTGRLQSGREVIIRLHPKGIINGYFYAEAAAALKVKNAGLPSYDTLAIHNFVLRAI